jgi:hypothetical protein
MYWRWPPSKHLTEDQMTKKKTRELTLYQNQSPAGQNQNPAAPENSKAGFYTRVLDEAEALDFETAAGAEGLDDEITLLRVKIKALLEKDPENLEMLILATAMLTRLVKARYSMNKKQEKNLGEAIKNIIRDIGVPLGVAVLNKKLQ